MESPTQHSTRWHDRRASIFQDSARAGDKGGAEEHTHTRSGRHRDITCTGTTRVDTEGPATTPEQLTWTCTLGEMQGRRTLAGCPGSHRRSSRGGRPSFGPRPLRFNSHKGLGHKKRKQETHAPSTGSCVNNSRTRGGEQRRPAIRLYRVYRAGDRGQRPESFSLARKRTYTPARCGATRTVSIAPHVTSLARRHRARPPAGNSPARGQGKSSAASLSCGDGGRLRWRWLWW